MGLDERAEADLRLLAGVAGQFSAQLGYRESPDRLAEMLLAQVPSSGLRGLLTLEGAAVAACEQTAKGIERGTVRDARNYLLAAFRNIVTGKDAPKGSSAAKIASADPDLSRDDAKFLGCALADVRDADREIRAMPSSRHRRVEAIEAWRRSLGTLPRPTWALVGSESPEAYERARRGLPADPEGPTVQRHVVTFGDMPDFRRKGAAPLRPLDALPEGDAGFQRALEDQLDDAEALGNGTVGR